jgi:DNA-binding transcriptional regulator YiaG
MTPAQFKAIREQADLTQTALAARLRISDNRSVRRWEAGDRAISGPVTILMELIDKGVDF